MRKSFHQAITDQEARVVASVKVGETAYARVKSYGTVEMIVGQVLVKHQTPHGQVVLLKNKYYTERPYNPPKGYACVGWAIIPIWVSDCGGSGVLCTYKNDPAKPDPDYLAAMQLYEALLVQREKEVECCLAL